MDKAPFYSLKYPQTLISMKKKEISEAARALALMGGRATLKKHGKKHYKLMAKKRWAKSRSKRAKK